MNPVALERPPAITVDISLAATGTVLTTGQINHGLLVAAFAVLFRTTEAIIMAVLHFTDPTGRRPVSLLHTGENNTAVGIDTDTIWVTQAGSQHVERLHVRINAA